MNAGWQDRRVVLLIVTQLAVLGLALLWGFLADIPWWCQIRTGSWMLGGAGLGILLALVTQLIFLGLDRRGFADVRWFLHEFLVPTFSGLSAAQIVLLAALSGFAEEALFRGVLLPELGLWPSSLLFGLLHTGDRRLLLPGLWAVLVGAGLGWMYLSSGELSTCMMVHAVNNMFSLWLLQGMAREEMGDGSTDLGEADSPVR